MEFLPTEIDGNKVYAGFLKRFGAKIVDMFVFIPFMFLFHYMQGISIPVAIMTASLSSVLFSFYTVFFHYRFGATLGKMAVSIKITLPNGSGIGFKQAILRSSVDLGFSLLVIISNVAAISSADPEVYLAAGWVERAEYVHPLLPVWYGIVSVGFRVWVWSEVVVILFNQRRRALHDFIAGTIVINQEYAEHADSKGQPSGCL